MMIRLHEWTGWPASVLFTNPGDRFSHAEANINPEQLYRSYETLYSVGPHLAEQVFTWLLNTTQLFSI